MKVLLDIGHPAHVHLFKNLTQHFSEYNIEYRVVTRNKEITNALLEHYKIPYQSLSEPGKGWLGMLMELLKRDWKIFWLHRRERFTHAIGTSVSIGHLSFLSMGKVQSWNFSEDDDDVIPIQAFLSYPTSTKVFNPDCLRFRYWKKKRVLYPSYHELAYLHPNNFTPDESVLEKYGLQRNRYIILRLVSLTAHHDAGVTGISPELHQEMRTMLNNYTIIESMEGKAGNKIAPWDMHHVLAFSKMIISDSQTMTMEAGVLGIPAVRINSFADRCSVIQELENKYQLTFGFLPRQARLALQKIRELLQDDNLEMQWSNRRSRLLADKVDLNQRMIEHFGNLKPTD